MRSERYSWNEKNNKHGANGDQSTPEFQLELQEQQAPGKSDGCAKLVTCREGSYVRQYIVRADGSRVLLSEVKQPEAEANPIDKSKQDNTDKFSIPMGS